MPTTPHQLPFWFISQVSFSLLVFRYILSQHIHHGMSSIFAAAAQVSLQHLQCYSRAKWVFQECWLSLFSIHSLSLLLFPSPISWVTFTLHSWFLNSQPWSSGLTVFTLQMAKYMALPQQGSVQAEYIWIDGDNGVRSKTKVSGYGLLILVWITTRPEFSALYSSHYLGNAISPNGSCC